VRHFLLARRAGLPAAAAVLGVLAAAPAFADVTVSPTTAVQGSGQNLTFHVTNTGTQPLHTVTLKLPDDTPVAEVYPLSVDDWAPKIEMRTLATPLATIHGGTPATETAKSITWLAVGGHDLKPGASADLPVAIGPLPTLSTMQFTVVSTYANGQAGPAMPPAQLALTPDTTGQVAAGHAAHGGGAEAAQAADTGTTAEDAQFAAAVADATRGPSIWSILGWVVAAGALIAGIVLMLRGRHRAAEDDEPEDEDEGTPMTGSSAGPDGEADDESEETEEEREPVSAGKWSLRA
jgi:hypothetical protein